MTLRHPVSPYSFIRVIKLQVVFRKRATNYRAVLRIITYGDKAFYDSTPPCITILISSSHDFSCTLEWTEEMSFLNTSCVIR